MMKKVVSLLLALVLMFSLSTCFAEAAPFATVRNTPAKDLKFGFAQLGLDGPWRVANSESYEQEAATRGYEIVITNAEGSLDKQLSDVEDLLAQGCNVMILPPLDMDGIKPALDACKTAGVPVFLSDRAANGVPGEDYITLVASDFTTNGLNTAKWALAWMEANGIEQGKAVEIIGTAGSGDVIERSAGFQQGMDESNGKLMLVARQTANWTRAEAQNVMQNIIQSTGGDFNVVYTHNDQMALGASLALEQAGLVVGKDVILCSSDGTIECMEAILADRVSTTTTVNPKLGPAMFDIIERWLGGEDVPVLNYQNDVLVDKTNAEQEMISKGF